MAWLWLWALPQMAFAIAVLQAPLAAQASHLPTYSKAATPEGFTIELSWTGHIIAGVEQPLALVIRNPEGQPLQWQELQVAAERHVHIMVAGCDSFIHIHVEDFTISKQYTEQLPGAHDTSFQLWMTLPHVGRYVAGIEFVDLLGGEHVAYVPLEALAHPRTSTDSASMQTSHRCEIGASSPFSHVRSLSLTAGGVNVDSVVLSEMHLSALAPGALYNAGVPVPDGFSVQMMVAPAGGGMDMSGGGMAASGMPVVDITRTHLTVGRCYHVRWNITDYGSGQPVTDLVPFLTHAMHIAVLPVHSLWTLDHFHAVAGDASSMMGNEHASHNPCDMSDDSMPEAPPSFGPVLTSWYQFKVPGAYRLICQALRAGKRMLLASYIVHVRTDYQQATA